MVDVVNSHIIKPYYSQYVILVIMKYCVKIVDFRHIGWVWIWLIASTFCFQRVSTIFFFLVAALVDFLSMNSASVYYSRTHKFHFSVIFSLKIGFTILFTHLKIILLQYFQFQQNKFNSIRPIEKTRLKTFSSHKFF